MSKKAFVIEADGKVFPVTLTPGNVQPEISPGLYTVGFDRERGFYLSPEKPFKIEGKVYGSVNCHVDRFMRSYELNDRNLGVLLQGFPGSGKSLTMKAASIKAIEMGMPVILVNEPYTGQSFINFMNAIEQNCVVNFDEFEKVYYQDSENPNIQITILALLDGASTGNKKLFIFTSNDNTKISEYMKARPSRVRYNLHFNGYEYDAMVEYLKDNLVDVNDRIIREFSMVFFVLGGFLSQKFRTLDILREIVREMNQFKEPLVKVLEWINGQKVNHSALSCVVFSGVIFNEKLGIVGNENEASYRRTDGTVYPVLINIEDYQQSFRIEIPADELEAKLKGLNEDEAEKVPTHYIVTLNHEDFIRYVDLSSYLYKKDGIFYLVSVRVVDNCTPLEGSITVELSQQYPSPLSEPLKRDYSQSVMIKKTS